MESFTELWDNLAAIEANYAFNVEILSRVVEYSRERLAIEKEYAKKIKNLNKVYLQVDAKRKSKADEVPAFDPLSKLWLEYLVQSGENVLNNEISFDETDKKVCDFAKKAYKEYEKQKSQWSTELKQAFAGMDKLTADFDKTYKKALTDYKSCQDARALFEKVDGDMNQTKAAIKKAKEDYGVKLAKSKESIEALEAAYSSFFEKEGLFFKEKLPSILRWMDDIEDARAQGLKEILILMLTNEHDSNERLVAFIDSFKKETTELDIHSVRSFVINKHRSANTIPFPSILDKYEPLPGMELCATGKVRLALTDDDIFKSSPAKVSKRGSKRLIELDEELVKIDSKKEGLEKLLASYLNDPKMANGSHTETIELELENLMKDRVAIVRRKAKVQRHMDSISIAGPYTESDTASEISARVSIAPSTITTEVKPIKQKGSNLANNMETWSPNSTTEELDHLEKSEDEAAKPEKDEKTEKIQVVALYDFATETPEELPITEGESLTLLEITEDWYYVSNKQGRQGFVPSNYVEKIAQ